MAGLVFFDTLYTTFFYHFLSIYHLIMMSFFLFLFLFVILQKILNLYHSIISLSVLRYVIHFYPVISLSVVHYILSFSPISFPCCLCIYLLIFLSFLCPLLDILLSFFFVSFLLLLFSF